MMFEVSRRPFVQSKTNFKELLVVTAYFARANLFLPVFFALIQTANNQVSGHT